MNEYLAIKAIESSEDFNKKLDEYLRRTNGIPIELLVDFDKAYRYDASTTIHWLINKLSIIHKRVQDKEVIFISNEEKELTIERFKNLILDRYSRIEKDLFKK